MAFSTPFVPPLFFLVMGVESTGVWRVACGAKGEGGKRKEKRRQDTQGERDRESALQKNALFISSSLLYVPSCYYSFFILPSSFLRFLHIRQQSRRVLSCFFCCCFPFFYACPCNVLFSSSSASLLLCHCHHHHHHHHHFSSSPT